MDTNQLTDEVRDVAARVRDVVTKKTRREAAQRRRRRLTGAAAAAGGMAAAGAVVLRSSTGVVEESIDVDVPVTTAYNQWTQFEQFPSFMEGVVSVRQLDDTHLHWVASVGGQTREWDAEITEQHPDERIAWHATGGKRNGGVVTFHRLSDERTRVMVQLEFEPESTLERVGSAIGADARRVRGDLKRFKEMLEARGSETGAWRGEVDRPDA